MSAAGPRTSGLGSRVTPSVGARRLALGAVGPLMMAACIAAPGPDDRPACTSVADCNGVAGEVCDEGVCWGDPPIGSFAAVLSPASPDSAARTEVIP